jgi:hypothetical protein
MAKSPAPDAIMSPDKMKPLLALSKREPVQAAIGLTSDGEGVILLDKKAKPRKVMSMLRADAAKAKLQLNAGSLRFGRAEVDTDYDAAMVRFFVNKDPPGNMRVKLVEVVKRIPYQKVEINVDPSLEAEAEEDDAAAAAVAEPSADATPAQAAEAPPAPAAAPPDFGGLARELALQMRRIPEATATDAAIKARVLKLATDGNAAIKANNAELATSLITQLRESLDGAAASRIPPPPPPLAAAPQQQPKPADAASLAHDLGPLIRRIGAVSGTDATLKGSLAAIAGEANNAIKANDPGAARAAMSRLREAIDDATAQTWQSARDAWRDANDAVNDQINALRQALLDEARQGDGDVEGMAMALTDVAENGLNAITEDHRVRLMAAVMALGGGEPAAMRKSAAPALGLIEAFDGFLASSPKVAACDDNPYGAAVSIRATLGPPLKQMAAALKGATAG